MINMINIVGILSPIYKKQLKTRLINTIKGHMTHLQALQVSIKVGASGRETTLRLNVVD